MQNAPARQPRVSPAAPRTGRSWVTAASLVGAALMAGAAMVPPFAVGTLFPSRSIASSASSSRAVETTSVETGTTSPMAAPIPDKPDAAVEVTYSDLPLAAEPANEPPRGAASEVPPGTPRASGTAATGTLATGTLATGTLATGVFAARLAPETGAADPATQLAVQPISPLLAA